MSDCPFSPTGNRVCLVPQLQELTKAGIVLPKGEQERNKFFVVVAVGPDCEHINVGDQVLPPLHPMAIQGMKFEGTDWFLTDEPSIPAVLNRDRKPDIKLAGHGQLS